MAIFTYGEPISKYEKLVYDITYTEQFEFPNGTLPVEKDILCCMLYLLRPGKAERTVNEAAEILAYNLIEHWHLFNIYTIPVIKSFKCTKSCKLQTI